MQQSNEFFATSKPRRLFFTVALPGMISMLAASIYSIIEGVVVGRLLGEAAFAAINIAMPFVFINFSLADLVGVGSSAPISIALGRKDEKKANNAFSCALIMILLAAVFMGVLLFTVSPLLVKLMGATGELATLAVRYVRVFALLGPISTVIFAMDNYLRICGFVKGSMMLNIFMSCLTAALVWLFLGVVGMNVEGAALASSSAMAFCALVAFTPFLFKKTVLKLVKPKFSFMLIKEIVTCGLPVFLNNVAGRVAAILMNTALLRVGGEAMGQTAVAAYSVLMYAGGIIEPLLYGMSDSVHPAVGYNWGAKRLDRVRDITKWSLGACGVVSVIGAVVMFFFPQAVVSIFVDPKDTALIELSVHALRLFSTAYLFRWLGFAVQGFYSSIEKPLPASIISVCSAMVLPLLFIVVLDFMGLDGLWLNMSATSFVVMLMSVIMLRISQKTMKHDIERTDQKEGI